MLKKRLLFFLGIIILFFFGVFIYWNLPIEISRKQDITLGNNLIKNIEKYKAEYNKLPVENDWETLQKLGFQIEELGTEPDYAVDLKGNYQITFLEGFDAPYLIWNSIDREWKIDFPTISSLIKGKSVIFIRPSEEKFESLKDKEGIYEVDSDFGFAIQHTMDGLSSQSKYKNLKFYVITDKFIDIQDCKNGPVKIDTDTLLYRTILTAPEKEIQIINDIYPMGYLSVIDEFYGIK